MTKALVLCFLTFSATAFANDSVHSLYGSEAVIEEFNVNVAGPRGAITGSCSGVELEKSLAKPTISFSTKSTAFIEDTGLCGALSFNIMTLAMTTNPNQIEITFGTAVSRVGEQIATYFGYGKYLVWNKTPVTLTCVVQDSPYAFGFLHDRSVLCSGSGASIRLHMK